MTRAQIQLALIGLVKAPFALVTVGSIFVGFGCDSSQEKKSGRSGVHQGAQVGPTEESGAETDSVPLPNGDMQKSGPIVNRQLKTTRSAN